MTDCGWLSDRIPAVARHGSEWTPEEVQHLNSCPACKDEWQLVQVAGRLGENAGISFDSPAIVSSVLSRLAHERKMSRARRRTWGFAGLVAAAGVAAAVWVGAMGESATPSSPGPVVAGRLMIPLPELENLQPAELDSVLQTMDEASVNGVTMDEPGLGNLNSDELQSVLDSWEG